MENRLPQTTRVLCEPSVAGWQNIISHRGFKGMRAWCASTPSRPANERRVFLFISLVNFKKIIVGISIWVGMKKRRVQGSVCSGKGEIFIFPKKDFFFIF
jgi:hypothetical protein